MALWLVGCGVETMDFGDGERWGRDGNAGKERGRVVGVQQWRGCARVRLDNKSQLSRLKLAHLRIVILAMACPFVYGVLRTLTGDARLNDQITPT